MYMYINIYITMRNIYFIPEDAVDRRKLGF